MTLQRGILLLGLGRVKTSGPLSATASLQMSLSAIKDTHVGSHGTSHEPQRSDSAGLCASIVSGMEPLGGLVYSSSRVAPT
jgi:hypothetical protein